MSAQITLTPQQEASYKRSMLSVSAGLTLSSISAGMWFPFLPLYLLQVGAANDASALGAVGMGLGALGVARLVGGPIGGMVADHVGRKTMFVVALAFEVLTTALLGVITAPWQIMIALGLDGLFSGAEAPAAALISVSVPEEKIKSGLAWATSSRYFGQTVGPIIGALSASLLGYRDTIFLAALTTGIGAVLVWCFAANDRDDSSSGNASKRTVKWFRPSTQLVVAIGIFAVVVCLNTLTKVATPIALKQFDAAHVAQITGAAFSIGGLTSAVGLLLLTARLSRINRLRGLLAGLAALLAVAYVLLSSSSSVQGYIVVFSLVSICLACMVPIANSFIAFNTPPERRGSAFGLASVAQASAMIIGPSTAALFVAHSLKWGFGILAGVCVVLIAVIALVLKRLPTKS